MSAEAMLQVLLKKEVEKSRSVNTIESLLSLMNSMSEIGDVSSDPFIYIPYQQCIANYLRNVHGSVAMDIGVILSKKMFEYRAYMRPFNKEAVAQIISAFEDVNKKITDALKELQ
jgi:hypothetical protein